MKQITRFEIKEELKEAIKNYCENRGESASNVTDMLFYLYWKGKVKIDYRPIDLKAGKSICLSLNTYNLEEVRKFKKTDLAPSIKYVFIYMWTELLEDRISID